MILQTNGWGKKLVSDEGRREIRRRILINGEDLATVAAEFKVSVATVCRIVGGARDGRRAAAGRHK